MPVVSALYRYPVKGLSPEALPRVMVTAGEALPFDRAFAIENGPGTFDPAEPRHLPKVAFLCLMRNERLATLATRFADDTHELTIDIPDGERVRGRLDTEAGRTVIAAFMSRFMAGQLRGPPRVVSAPGHSFSDVREKCVHIINRASLMELQTVTGRVIDPLRFRPNLVLDGLPAWAELDLVGQEIAIEGVRLKVFKRTVRCPATDVDPATGVRAGDLPGAIRANLGHQDFGVYAMVTTGGELRQGAKVLVAGTVSP